MTTTQLIDTLTRGAPITARLVREIITQLHSLQWTRTALATTLERYANGLVTLEAEEAGWVCAALDEHARLKEALQKIADGRGMVPDNSTVFMNGRVPEVPKAFNRNDMIEIAKKALDQNESNEISG